LGSEEFSRWGAGIGRGEMDAVEDAMEEEEEGVEGSGRREDEIEW
jgi:hypothetical protein